MFKCLILILFLAPCLNAYDEQKVDAWIQKQEYEKARDYLKPMAEKGSGHAQNKLGELYQRSLPPFQNYELARHWYLEAYKNGSGVAASHLGRLYLNGEGVPKNKETAQQWYERSLRLGCLEGGANYYYRKGNGVYFLFEEASLNNPRALLRLSEAYQLGDFGLSKDEHLATLYKEKALELMPKNKASGA